MNKIRVLGIAPYEGLKTLMANLAAEYPQIDLTLFVGEYLRRWQKRFKKLFRLK